MEAIAIPATIIALIWGIFSICAPFFLYGAWHQLKAIRKLLEAKN